MKTRKCWATEKPIDVTECQTCLTRSCPINTGFTDEFDEGPIVEIPKKKPNRNTNKKWECWVTGQHIDIEECANCETQSCPINTGYADNPKPLR